MIQTSRSHNILDFTKSQVKNCLTKSLLFLYILDNYLLTRFKSEDMPKKRKLPKRKYTRMEVPCAEKEPLNERQELLCNIYTSMEVPDKFSAYKKAGYTGEGASGKVACYQIYNRPNVAYRIGQLRRERMERLRINGDEVIRKLLVLASSNILDFMEFDNLSLELKDSDDLTREQAYCIQEISEVINRNGTRQVKFKLVDKKSCLALLAQHFGLTDPSKSKDDNESNPKEQAEAFKNHLDTILGSVPLNPEEEETSNE